MATKTANVTARVNPEIKDRRKPYLTGSVFPYRWLIDTLYRQIIMTGGIPYSISMPKMTTLDGMTPEQFDAIMQKGYDEARLGIGLSVEDAFKKIREGI